MKVVAMKVVAILQNQWTLNPERTRLTFERHPDKRNELIARFLFRGCLTGRRLRQAFGSLCEQIVWEESSSEIGGVSSSRFAADPYHIHRLIVREKPDIVLCFGRTALNGVLTSMQLFTGERTEFYVMGGPHPAARAADTMDKLRAMADDLNRRMVVAW